MTRLPALNRRLVAGSLAALGLRAPAFAAGHGRASPVVELRQYTMQPGRRDDLIDLFEQEFIESQEALGATIIGTFRDLDRPDRFVWLRGFPDMIARKAALSAFYGGPAWKAHRSAANATIIDSDNVLLLRPPTSRDGFDLSGAERAPPGARKDDGGVVGLLIQHWTQTPGPSDVSKARAAFAAAARAGGGRLLALLVTEPASNTFPALPVREGEQVMVVAVAFDEEAAQVAATAATPWRAAAGRLRARAGGEAELVRLAPTARSLLRR